MNVNITCPQHSVTNMFSAKLQRRQVVFFFVTAGNSTVFGIINACHRFGMFWAIVDVIKKIPRPTVNTNNNDEEPPQN